MIKLTKQLGTTPAEGEIDETVGASVSSVKAYDSKAGMVAEIPRLL